LRSHLDCSCGLWLGRKKPLSDRAPLKRGESDGARLVHSLRDILANIYCRHNQIRRRYFSTDVVVLNRKDWCDSSHRKNHFFRLATRCGHVWDFRKTFAATRTNAKINNVAPVLLYVHVCSCFAHDRKTIDDKCLCSTT
jgi:hypothetical protein